MLAPGEISGLLNSTLLNAVNKRKATGTKLLLAALAVNKAGQDVYDTVKVRDIVGRLNNPAVSAVTGYKGEAARKLLQSIVKGDNPLTQ